MCRCSLPFSLSPPFSMHVHSYLVVSCLYSFPNAIKVSHGDYEGKLKILKPKQPLQCQKETKRDLLVGNKWEILN